MAKLFLREDLFTIRYSLWEKNKPAQNYHMWLEVVSWRCFIRPVQDDHFRVVPRVVVLYRFDIWTSWIVLNLRWGYLFHNSSSDTINSCKLLTIFHEWIYKGVVLHSNKPIKVVRFQKLANQLTQWRTCDRKNKDVINTFFYESKQTWGCSIKGEKFFKKYIFTQHLSKSDFLKNRKFCFDFLSAKWTSETRQDTQYLEKSTSQR